MKWKKNEQKLVKTRNLSYQVAKSITKSEYYFVCRENAVCSVNGNKSKIIMIHPK